MGNPVKTLSATMVACIDFAQEHGGLIRMQGGFWTRRGAGWNGMRPNAEYFGASTVQACVDRGELEYTEWREGRSDRFPIAANVSARASLSAAASNPLGAAPSAAGSASTAQHPEHMLAPKGQQS